MNFLGMGVRETRGVHNTPEEISSVTWGMSAAIAISHGPLRIPNSHYSVYISNEDECGR